jgi:hypothetical protein
MPGGSRRNLDWALAFVDVGDHDEVHQLLLADAQTSGGLVFGVDPSETASVLAELAATRSPGCAHRCGSTPARRVSRCTDCTGPDGGRSHRLCRTVRFGCGPAHRKSSRERGWRHVAGLGRLVPHDRRREPDTTRTPSITTSPPQTSRGTSTRSCPTVRRRRSLFDRADALADGLASLRGRVGELDAGEFADGDAHDGGTPGCSCHVPATSRDAGVLDSHRRPGARRRHGRGTGALHGHRHPQHPDRDVRAAAASRGHRRPRARPAHPGLRVQHAAERQVDRRPAAGYPTWISSRTSPTRPATSRCRRSSTRSSPATTSRSAGTR